jgi:microcystin-dependent protein
MAWPVTLYDRTFDEKDFAGNAYVTGLPDAFEKFVAHAASQWNGTTTASLTIGGGSKSFTTQTGKPWRIGAPLRLSAQVAPAAAWMDCVVTAYDATTGACSVQVVGAGGSGSYSSWIINAGGGGYAINTPLTTAQGGTGAADPAGARAILQAAYSGLVITAGEGLDGGGPLTGNVTLAFAPGEEGEEPPDINADMFVYWDSASGRSRRVRMSAVLAQTAADIGSLATVAADPQNDFLALYHQATNSSAKAPLSALGLLPVGALVPWAGASTNAPAGFLLCGGQRVSKAVYPLLWNVLGDTWGQSDAAQFVVPDLRGRVVAGHDGMAGAAAFRLGATLDKGGAVGSAGGEEYHTLSVNEMPSHTHSFGVFERMYGSVSIANFPTGSGNGDHVYQVTSTGGGEKHNNVQPTAMANYLIRAA